MKLIYDKINMGKNSVVKNVMNNFYHFLDINEKSIVIPNNEKNMNQTEIKPNNNENQNEKNNFNYINISNINTININNLSKNNAVAKNVMMNQMKDCKTRPSSKDNSKIKGKKINETKTKYNNINNNNKKNNNNIISKNNAIGKHKRKRNNNRYK